VRAGQGQPGKRVRVVVRGRVQGVGFRAATAYEARRLGLAGWVRNLPDGGVEVEARGPTAAVDALVAWLGHGPSYAHVSGIDVDDTPSENPASEGLQGFSIR
jgi:acylphosphatase